ncbi:hypothetical protein [Rhizobium sp. R634]|uniref:hypothetical protein n=1 Tax=Rhizobium sp. R634 TaxID=1764274 RepID=UPI0011310E3E|nr:hypothetical protein [Rhizobium sp. R634]
MSRWAASTVVEGRPDPSDQYFHRRVLGSADNSYLDALDADVATELCSILGHMAATTDAKRMLDRVPDGFENIDCRHEGFEIAKLGEQAVSDFLRNRPTATDRRFGAHKSLYSPVIRWLDWNINDPNYKGLIDFFQSFAEQNLPMAPSERFVRPVNERIVHSVKSAAAEYDISEARIECVVREYRGFICGGKSFNRAAMHAHIIREQEMLTTSVAAKLLGCTVIVLTNCSRRACLATSQTTALGSGSFASLPRTRSRGF